MAESDKTVAFGITADASGFEKGMQNAASSASSAAKTIDSEFKKVQGAFSAVQGQLLLLASIVAGGAFFKNAIDASNQLTGEVVQLSKALGISTASASTLNLALKSIGSSADVYTDANAKLTKQIRTNEAGVNAMGVTTRGANGELLSGQAIMTNSIEALKTYKEGTDRNLAAQTLFGRGAADVTALLKLNTDVMDKATVKARELGMVLGPEQLANTKAYKEGINQVKLVLEAVENQIGQAVMPIFTQLATWFSDAGPTAIAVIKPALQAVGDVFGLIIDVARELGSMIKDVFLGIGNIITSVAGQDAPGAMQVWGNAMILVRVAVLGLKSGIVLAFEVIRGAVLVVVEQFKTFAEIAKAAFMLDWAGVKSAFSAGVQNVEKVLGDSQKRILDKTAETSEQMQRVLMGGSVNESKPAPAAGKVGTREYKPLETPGAPVAEKPRTGAWETELAEQKLAFQERMNLEKSFAQFGKQAELDFWQEKKTLTKNGSAENLTVRKKEADLQLAMGQEVFAREIASLQAQEAAFKTNTSAKLALLDQQQALVKQRYGKESKEYEQVQKQIVETKRQAVEQQKQIDMQISQGQRNAAMAELQGREQQAQLELELGNITAQELLKRQIDFESEKAAILLAGLQERQRIAAADPDTNLVELEKIHQEIQQAERQHQLQLQQIKNQAMVQQTTNSRQMWASITGDAQSGIAKMMQGQLSFGGFMKSIWQSITGAVTNALAKNLITFLVNTQAMAAIKKAFAIFDIGTSATKAGASAIADAAETGPWWLAPLAGAATFAAASAFAGSIPAFSAAGGYDIPGTINPITQLHANEMVLPAKHADVIRSMADNSGSGGGGGGGDVHYHSHAVVADDKVMRRFFLDNYGHVLEAQRRAMKDRK